MNLISAKDILINARQESIQMRHYYLGVEHLFIAMLQIHGGILSSIIEDYGLTPDYVIDTIRRKTDKGISQRLWAGFPYTPRVEIILDIAKDLADENGIPEITERELLVAILTEDDSLPIRVLHGLGVNTRAMTLAAIGYDLKQDPQPPVVAVIIADNSVKDSLQSDQLFVLRRMFSSHNSIRIERQLTGFSGAIVLVVTPIQADEREDAPVVVKINSVDKILDEVQRYEVHVKGTLPLQTARLEDFPVTPEASELAGIKYTLVANSEGTPLDLRTHIQSGGQYDLATFLRKELYERFKITWWQHKRPFRFQAWKEYDWTLPPLLTLDYLLDSEVVDGAITLKSPINRSKLRDRIKALKFGSDVIIENFTIQRIDTLNHTLRLAIAFGSEADKAAYRIDVRGTNNMPSSLFRGEVVERIAGSVWKTRHDHMLDHVRELEPDFDFNSDWICINEQDLPNPLFAYEDWLDWYVSGSMSKIHGDLHLGNILVGPNNTPWLIDFGSTRDGHTLFDWASLEISYVCESIGEKVANWNLLQAMSAIILDPNSRYETPNVEEFQHFSLDTIIRIREIVDECLATKDSWNEYYVALAFCGLRASGWKTMSLGGRRLAFLISALSFHKLSQKTATTSKSDSLATDRTDITDHLPLDVRLPNADDN
ncbi:MAG: Clp protease N-terminal domain-containing protein [Anaerolineae bacterium]